MQVDVVTLVTTFSSTIYYANHITYKDSDDEANRAAYGSTDGNTLKSSDESTNDSSFDCTVKSSNKPADEAAYSPTNGSPLRIPYFRTFQV
jgi:hypothetical protein